MTGGGEDVIIHETCHGERLGRKSFVLYPKRPSTTILSFPSFIHHPMDPNDQLSHWECVSSFPSKWDDQIEWVRSSALCIILSPRIYLQNTMKHDEISLLVFLSISILKHFCTENDEKQWKEVCECVGFQVQMLMRFGCRNISKSLKEVKSRKKKGKEEYITVIYKSWYPLLWWVEVKSWCVYWRWVSGMKGSEEKGSSYRGRKLKWKERRHFMWIQKDEANLLPPRFGSFSPSSRSSPFSQIIYFLISLHFKVTGSVKEVRIQG